MHDPSTDQELIGQLRTAMLRAITPLLTGAPRCALLGFPNHNNSGDSAIWLGELALLERLGVAIAYDCDDASYHRGDLASALPEGPILLHGGGNYGDLWPAQHHFRERVLRDFPDRHIVQLPQTVTFADADAVPAHRALLAQRDQPVSILCRDEVSARFVEEELGADAVLCADPALFLDLRARAEPVADVVLNERTDHESVGLGDLAWPGRSVERHDWLPGPGQRSLQRSLTVRTRTAARSLAAASRRDGVVAHARRRLPMIAARRLAERRVRFACSLLGRGRVVVTDRLHGHLLSMLLGIPHVIRDTRHHKVVNFHSTFSSASRTTFVADSADEVTGLVEELLAKRAAP